MDACSVLPRLAPRAAHEPANESAQSRIRWSAVIAGAVASAALALILLVLCVGLKLTTVSPWVTNTSRTILGVSTVVATILIQLIASAIGAYLAGRLRTKWVQVHDGEVYFSISGRQRDRPSCTPRHVGQEGKSHAFDPAVDHRHPDPDHHPDRAVLAFLSAPPGRSKRVAVRSGPWRNEPATGSI